ncbi:hypothetical protein [Pseudactinotalea sp. Z1732]|uniref:hypothetical protein n=1 Tax=Micrococcales TaxID=85006 RepID=UPI003C7D76F6
MSDQRDNKRWRRADGEQDEPPQRVETQDSEYDTIRKDRDGNQRDGDDQRK